jgi:hypothetical protein
MCSVSVTRNIEECAIADFRQADDETRPLRVLTRPIVSYLAEIASM